MRAACSATGLFREREGFGWTVRPIPGSVLASTRIASWDPEPDYFHHWIRDSAIVLRAVPLAIRAEPEMRAFWLQFIADFVAFSLAASDPSRKGPGENPLKQSARPEFIQYLRPDAELAALTGAAWLEEPRLSADGTPDLEKWGRPQDDGPALRATALTEVLQALPDAKSQDADTLIARDLDHVLRVAGRPCLGPWEEWPPRRSSFTLLVQWDALDGAASRNGANAKMKLAASRLEALMEQAQDVKSGGWRESIEAPPGMLDSATCLALLHAARKDGPFAMTAERTRATVKGLERIFSDLYPINSGRAVPAIGRWSGDVFFDGNPWFPNTLGFAALHYRIATLTRDRATFEKAEQWMALVQQVAPDPGPLPEQFDRVSGKPRSCLNLTWSAAAFLEAAAAREVAVQAAAGAR